MSISIRRATSADLPTLLQFEQGVVAAERPYNDQIKSGSVHYYDLAALIDSEQSRVLVAELAGQRNKILVGTGHATIKSSDSYVLHDMHAYLGLMYVDPDFRGQGVIQEVIQRLLAWSRSCGVTDFYLDVYAANEAAIRAYEKFGFRPNLVGMKMHDRS